jgi:hypothetical protein
MEFYPILFEFIKFTLFCLFFIRMLERKIKDKLAIKPTLEKYVPVQVQLQKIVDESKNNTFDRKSFLDRLDNLGLAVVKQKRDIKKDTNDKKEKKNDKKEEEKDIKDENDENNKKDEKEDKKTDATNIVIENEFDKKNIAERIGDTLTLERLPRKSQPIKIKAPAYYMNNREIFVNFITALYKKYKNDFDDTVENITCDSLTNKTKDFEPLIHQQIVRDYINMYTPYRGILLYHGLGSGKTCTSIIIAEGMKTSKHVYVMLPASLRPNYVAELKKCGDAMYKRDQYWEWISTVRYPNLEDTLTTVLNIPKEYVRKNKGAWMVNATKSSNFDTLSLEEKKKLEEQLDIMIETKYTFIHYNSSAIQNILKKMTKDFTINPFDNCVVIVDESHNLTSRIVNKLKLEKPIEENKKGEKAHLPVAPSMKIYEYLLSAKNARIVLMSGTPLINYLNEFGITMNILRGYIKTWNFTIQSKTTNKIDRDTLKNMLMPNSEVMDYLDYSPSSKVMSITRNPFGFRNEMASNEYKGVSNVVKDENGSMTFNTDSLSDDDFEKHITSVLKENKIDITSVSIRNQKALPDTYDEFEEHYINPVSKELKNTDALKRRVLGLCSYFRSAQESLLPAYTEKDYHVIKIPMSNDQFSEYEKHRKQERMTEKQSRNKNSLSNVFKENSSTYRIFSRMVCDFYIPERPMPIAKPKKQIADEAKEEEENEGDLNDDREGEVEGDEIMNKLGGQTYIELQKEKLANMKENADDYFSKSALAIYSPKYLEMLNRLQDDANVGNHLIYTQFLSMEGIAAICLTLNHNGFAQFKIRKNTVGHWEIDMPLSDRGKPCYGLYTGTVDKEEKEIIRNIYNGDWDLIPANLASELKSKYPNNNLGEVIKIFMITSSGSEGINLRNTRFVHIVEPYWHPVRTEQVIGRARRICSHKALPRELQTVTVFLYLMVFTPAQLESSEANELKRFDISKMHANKAISSDEYLYEISLIKANLIKQLTNVLKETSFDCYIYSKDGKCFNFVNPTAEKYSYVPDLNKQQNDTAVVANKQTETWKGQIIQIEGKEYIYRQIENNVLEIYDKESYENAIKNPNVIPVQVGTIEYDDKGEAVFKQT